MDRHLLFESLDDRLGRVVLQEETQTGLAVVDEAAEGRDVNFPEEAVHDVLHWQVEYLLEEASLADLLLSCGVLMGKIPCKDDQFIEKRLRISPVIVLLHLPLAVANHRAAAADEGSNQRLVLDFQYNFPESQQGNLAAAVQQFGCESHRALDDLRVTVWDLFPLSHAFSLLQLPEVTQQEGSQKLN